MRVVEQRMESDWATIAIWDLLSPMTIEAVKEISDIVFEFHMVKAL